MAPVIEIALDRDDLQRLVSGRRVCVPVDDEVMVSIALDLDGSRRDPPEAREFLPVRKAK